MTIIVSTIDNNTSVDLLIFLQATKMQNLKANIVCGSTPELRRTSSFDRTWEETVAESVANELVLQLHSSSIPSAKSGLLGSIEQHDEPSRNKLKDSKPVKTGRSSHEEKKIGKSHDEKRSRPRKMMEFHNIKISQVGSASEMSVYIISFLTYLLLD